MNDRPDSGAVRLRDAREPDLPALVALLADDALGATREDASLPLSRRYRAAFAAIDADPHQALVVAERDGAVVGLLQLTFIPSLTYRGSWRAQIEGVRVARSMRSSGLGRRLVSHALERARERGCRLVQLTTDKRRPRALTFYESLGFTASHEGMKLHLESPDGAP
ncbi:MAG: GNAT family N-acetyltransferase [Longimicrobiales bacterium]